MRVGLLWGELKLHNQTVQLVDDEDGADVLQPGLPQDCLGLGEEQEMHHTWAGAHVPCPGLAPALSTGRGAGPKGWQDGSLDGAAVPGSSL